MQVSEAIEGVKVYNLSAGKTLKEWLNDATQHHVNLRKSHDFRSRIELLQDAEFATTCNRLRFSRDGQFLVGVGTYRPSVRIWDLSELTLKTERFMDCEAVDMLLVDDDWKKIAILRNDRYVEFHTKHGSHYVTRIPKFGRQMAYEPETCDLIVCGDSSDVFRLNLEQGRHLSPFDTDMPSVNAVAVNPIHSLVGLGGSNGVVEAWDARDRRKCGSVLLSLPQSHGSTEVTSFAFASDGLTFAAGTAGGSVVLYDLRSATPLLVKEQGNGLPITSLSFHGVSSTDNEHASSRAALSAFAGCGPCVIASDRHLCKVWDRRTGETRVNIEVEPRINHVTTFSPDSGFLMMAAEHSRIQIFYVPSLGPAPRWCAFIDQMTEELEEEKRQHSFDDFKFVTRDDLAKVGLEHLLGTPFLRPYMHGYFVDVRLYSKMAAAANPFAFEDYRKQRIKERIEAKRSTRITQRKRAPTAVNAQLAERLLRQAAPEKGEQPEAEETGTGDVADLIDARFRDLFSNPDFELEPDKERAAQENEEESDDEGRVTRAGDFEPVLREMRGERSMHSMATTTAAALRGGSLTQQLRDVVNSRNVPLAVRAADEPRVSIQPNRVVREMTYEIQEDPARKNKRKMQ